MNAQDPRELPDVALPPLPPDVDDDAPDTDDRRRPSTPPRPSPKPTPPPPRRP